MPDARVARDPRGHFTQPFKLAAVRYAAACGKSQRAAARDMGPGDKTLGEWLRDARPDHFLFEGERLAGLVDFVATSNGASSVVGSVSVSLWPALSCWTNKGITEPREYMTFP